METSLKNKFEEVNDVTVHIDPEDDEITASCKHLPLRSELLLTLNNEWAKHDVLKNIDNVTLHYLDGHVHVEACLPLQYLNGLEDADSLKKEFDQLNSRFSYISKSHLYFS